MFSSKNRVRRRCSLISRAARCWKPGPSSLQASASSWTRSRGMAAFGMPPAIPPRSPWRLARASARNLVVCSFLMRDVENAHFRHAPRGVDAVVRVPVEGAQALDWIPGKEELVVACKAMRPKDATLSGDGAPLVANGTLALV